MSRQDANAAFALSSFLQGTNAAYIDDLYARYEQDPGSVDAEWQEFFKSLKDTPADVKKNAEGASWGRDNWPLTPRDELTSALDGNWATVEKAVGDQARRQGAGQGRRAVRRRRPPGDARFRPRADADPRLPHARPFPRQARSARHRGAARPRRTRSAHLWLHRSRFRPQDLPRPRARPRIRAPCARSSRSASAPTARRSASSSCTSPTPRRRPGSRSASRARTRKSASPPRAGARSSTS